MLHAQTSFILITFLAASLASARPVHATWQNIVLHASVPREVVGITNNYTPLLEPLEIEGVDNGDSNNMNSDSDPNANVNALWKSYYASRNPLGGPISTPTDNVYQV